MTRGTAVVYLPGDSRLEILCSVILRQMGHRVYEAADVDEAMAMVEAQESILLVSSAEVIANPWMAKCCSLNGVKCVRIDPAERIATLLPLLERRATAR